LTTLAAAAPMLSAPRGTQRGGKLPEPPAFGHVAPTMRKTSTGKSILVRRRDRAGLTACLPFQGPIDIPLLARETMHPARTPADPPCADPPREAVLRILHKYHRLEGAYVVEEAYGGRATDRSSFRRPTGSAPRSRDGDHRARLPLSRAVPSNEAASSTVAPPAYSGMRPHGASPRVGGLCCPSDVKPRRPGIWLVDRLPCMALTAATRMKMVTRRSLGRDPNRTAETAPRTADPSSTRSIREPTMVVAGTDQLLQ
jgi:hypothetical protein